MSVTTEEDLSVSSDALLNASRQLESLPTVSLAEHSELWLSILQFHNRLIRKLYKVLTDNADITDFTSAAAPEQRSTEEEILTGACK